MMTILILTPAEIRQDSPRNHALLTEVGTMQVCAVRTSLDLSESITPPFDVALYANILGAHPTAQAIAGNIPMPIYVRELTPDERQHETAIIATGIRMLGHTSPVREYALRDIGRELTCVGAMAHRAVANIINAQKAQSVLIVAEPLMVSLLALSFVNGHQDSKRITERVVNACQGYLLTSKSADNAIFHFMEV